MLDWIVLSFSSLAWATVERSYPTPVQAGSHMATKLKDGVFIGDAESSQDIDFLVSNKITRVINCAAANVPCSWERVGIQYMTFYWKGSGEIDLSANNVNRIINFMDSALNLAESFLVHSIDGRSRASAVVAVYFMHKYVWSIDKTMQYLHSQRPDLCPLPTVIKQLEDVQQRLLYRYRTNKRMTQRLSTVTWDVLPLEESKEDSNDEQLLVNTYFNSLPKDQAALDRAMRRQRNNAGSSVPRRRRKKRLRWIDGTSTVPKSPFTGRPTTERPPGVSYSDIQPGVNWVDTYSNGGGAGLGAPVRSRSRATTRPNVEPAASNKDGGTTVVRSILKGRVGNIMNPPPQDGTEGSIDNVSVLSVEDTQSLNGSTVEGGSSLRDGSAVSVDNSSTDTDLRWHAEDEGARTAVLADVSMPKGRSRVPMGTPSVGMPRTTTRERKTAPTATMSQLSLKVNAGSLNRREKGRQKREDPRRQLGIYDDDSSDDEEMAILLGLNRFGRSGTGLSGQAVSGSNDRGVNKRLPTGGYRTSVGHRQQVSQPRKSAVGISRQKVRRADRGLGRAANAYGVPIRRPPSRDRDSLGRTAAQRGTAAKSRIRRAPSPGPRNSRDRNTQRRPGSAPLQRLQSLNEPKKRRPGTPMNNSRSQRQSSNGAMNLSSSLTSLTIGTGLGGGVDGRRVFTGVGAIRELRRRPSSAGEEEARRRMQLRQMELHLGRRGDNKRGGTWR